ncbi:MAG: MFS transporter [Micropruina sp.]|uniref:MFS transporter n=1 Tax=Micropruina sp. TaxID=2737536 RepID=UPI0039E37CC7
MFSEPRRTIGLAAILIGIAASALMQTLLSTAMPRIASELDAADAYGWVFASYLLASTLPMPLFGHLADHRGRRTLLLWGVGGFLCGTAWVALASSGAALVAARVVQGVGAAALVPAALGAVGDLAGSRRGRFFGAVGIIQVVANVAGPLLGGWFTDGPGWRLGFWVVVPVGLLAMAAAAIGVPNTARSSWPDAWRSLDLLEPVRTVVGDPVMRRICGGACLAGAVLMVATVYLPFLVQARFGGSATDSSAALIALMAGVGVGSMLGGRAADRRSQLVGRASWVAIGVGCCGLVVLSVVPAGTIWLAAASGVIGVGVGTVMPLLLVRAQVLGGETATARASTVVQLARNLGGAVGTVLLGLFVATG